MTRPSTLDGGAAAGLAVANFATEADQAGSELVPSTQRVFFVHVMKTGGSNLVWHFKEGLAPEEVFPNAQDYRFVDGKLDAPHHLSLSYLLGIPEERRRVIRLYTSHYPYLGYELLGEDLTTLAVLRDPVERTISLLRALGRPGIWADRTKMYPMASWPLEKLYEHPDHFESLIHNHQTKMFSMTAADRPATFRDVIDIDEARLALAKRNLEHVDVLGVNERYADLLEEVERRLGWKVPAGSRVNQGRTDDDRVASASFRRRIAEDNAIDMAFHQHAIELVTARRSR